MPAREPHSDPESRRLAEDQQRLHNWKRWGPYLSERQWGTVREDYSGDGSAWDYFPHEHARSRAYRWGEDGLLGFVRPAVPTLLRARALERRATRILKERLFGLSGPQGNHGEDVKEEYYYLEATPTLRLVFGALPLPAAAVPLRASWSRRTACVRAASPSSNWPTRACFEREPRTSSCASSTPRTRPRTSSSACTPPTAAPSRRRCTCCPRSGCATPGPGANREEGVGEKPLLSAHSPSEIAAKVPGLGEYRLACEGSRRALLHRERHQYSAYLRHAERCALREGRLPPPRGPRRGGRGQPGAHGHQGGRALRDHARAGRDAHAAPAPLERGRDTRTTLRAGLRQALLAAALGVRGLLRRAPADRARRARAQRASSRPTRACSGRSSSTTTSSRTGCDGDPAQPPPPPERMRGPQQRLAAPLQPRRDLDAGQVGVSRGTRPGTSPST